MSAKVAFENLMLAVLRSAEGARGAGDEAALFAYFDVLDVALSEAKDNDIEFGSPELQNLDPYELLRVPRPR